MNAQRRFWSKDGEGGQAVVLIAITFMAMMFAVGLAIDSGQLFVAKRTEQEAADAAAFAGAIQLYLGGTQVQAIAAARADATLNGYTDGVGNIKVTVNAPPQSGAYNLDPLSVEVIIVDQVKTTLVPAEAFFNPVRARSVAQAAAFASQFAIVALYSGTGPCITVSNTGGISVPQATGPPVIGGAIQANCSGTSLNLSGSGGITDPLGVYSVGAVNPASRVTGPVVQPAPRQRDPFAGFPKPPLNPPTFTNFVVPSTACNAATPLLAGTYVGGIKNTQPCTVYMANGVYILKGGGFDQGAGPGGVITNVPAGGLMLFNTHDNYPGIPGVCGSITADSGGLIDIAAMTPAQSPQYAGMGIYQDQACTNVIAIVSNSGLNVHGTLYAPSAQLSIQSQSSGKIDAQLVVYTVDMSSSGTLTVNYAPSNAAQTRLPSLVE